MAAGYSSLTRANRGWGFPAITTVSVNIAAGLTQPALAVERLVDDERIERLSAARGPRPDICYPCSGGSGGARPAGREAMGGLSAAPTHPQDAPFISL